MFAEPVAFIIYFLILSGLILFTGLLRIFEGQGITRKKLVLLFLGKVIAIPVFLFVYNRLYGGIENFDTGKFYQDVKVISAYGKKNPAFLIRILSGFQEDAENSNDYVQVLKYTQNWDNGTVKDYLYNDNRVVIRAHVLLDLLPFASYPVHALLNCFLSFIGILFLYKTFREWFQGKEFIILLILCFFPALWFYTGALLKEGITFFVLGCLLYQLKKISSREGRLLNLVWLSCLLCISLLLKPYLLFFALICFTLFFVILNSQKVKRKILLFFSLIVIVVVLVNVVSIFFKQRSLHEAAVKHQHRFRGVSKGGIFLADSVNFIRLTNDTSQIKKVAGREKVFTIKKNVSYMYWKTAEQLDTLYRLKNQDTSTQYQLAYIIQPSRSNIELPGKNMFYMLAACLYYTLLYPTFFSAGNSLLLLASFENLAVLAAILIVGFGFIRSKKQKFLPAVFVFFAASLCLLIGLTAPNSGAIFRYRSPAMIFLLLSALYFIPLKSTKKEPERPAESLFS